MKTKLYNAKILTKDFTVIDGGLCVKDDTIMCVFEGDKCRDNDGDCAFDREIDCGGNLLMPTFKNAHTHSAMTFLRSRADDLPLQQWLETQVFPQEAKLTEEHIHWFTKLAILEYLAGGISAAFDMYFEPEAVATAAVDTGFRITMCGSVNNFGTTPENLHNFYKKYNGYNELVAYKLGFHAEYTNSIDNMKQVAELSKQYGAPVYTHMSETKAEVNGCFERHGKSPATLFTELGLWEHGGGAFHAVHVERKDMKLMSERGVWAISCPGSNLKLASGIAPLMKMQSESMKIALGTDGAASNNALSMFREMYFACTLQKHLQGDAAACPATTVLEWATAGSAEAMGLANCDCLETGKKADIMMLDLSRPAMRPHNNLAKNVVYAGDTSAVKMTMVNGKVLYKDGVYTLADGTDSAHIIEKCEQLMRDFD